MRPIFTVGHSNHSIDHFVGLVTGYGVTAIADVRSRPASRYCPQFNREALKQSLLYAGIRYAFLGAELGARVADPSCYVGGKVQYDRLAIRPEFLAGINRIVDGASRETIALMCAEQEPLECHRGILLARVLVERGASINHIFGDGGVESHERSMARLREMHHLGHPSLWEAEEVLLIEALGKQESQIAYTDSGMADLS